MRAIILLIALALPAHAANYAGITPSVASPGVGGTVVNFTAAASGGSGQYQYKFWRLPITDGYAGLWSMVRDYTTDATYSFNVPAGGGQQYIGVWVRDLGSSAEYEGNGSIFWEAQPAPIVTAGVPACGPLVLSALGAAYSNPTGANYLPIGGKAYTAGSYPFPFTVPAGRVYEISSIHFIGKKIMGADGVVRTGQVILTNLFTLDSMTPLVFPTPLPIPAGFTLDGLFSNDTASQPMNMIVMVIGKLTGAECTNN